MLGNAALRVLIVEDDFLVREWIQRLLEMIGCQVAGTAADGLKAVEQAEALRPDVILMDIGLPGTIDGLEAAQRIAEACPAPVVILSAYETPDMLARASAAGVGAYLTKPTDEHALERALIIAQARFKDVVALRQLNAQLQAEIARRQQAEIARTRMAQELMTLYEVSLEINTQPDWPKLLHLICSRLAKLLLARTCVLYLAQPNGLLAAQAVFGAGESHPALAGDSYLTQLAIRTQINGQALLPDGFQHEGHMFNRVMSLPLQAGNRDIGVLVLADDQRSEAFNEHEFWLAGLFAEQAAIAIENAQLRQAARSVPA